MNSDWRGAPTSAARSRPSPRMRLEARSSWRCRRRFERERDRRRSGAGRVHAVGFRAAAGRDFPVRAVRVDAVAALDLRRTSRAIALGVRAVEADDLALPAAAGQPAGQRAVALHDDGPRCERRRLGLFRLRPWRLPGTAGGDAREGHQRGRQHEAQGPRGLVTRCHGEALPYAMGAVDGRAQHLQQPGRMRTPASTSANTLAVEVWASGRHAATRVNLRPASPPATPAPTAHARSRSLPWRHWRSRQTARRRCPAPTRSSPDARR